MVRRRKGPTQTEILQIVRLLDVFLIGPLMIYTATQATTIPKIPRYALGMVGVGSMLFNGTNFLLTRRRRHT